DEQFPATCLRYWHEFLLVPHTRIHTRTHTHTHTRTHTHTHAHTHAHAHAHTPCDSRAKEKSRCLRRLKAARRTCKSDTSVSTLGCPVSGTRSHCTHTTQLQTTHPRAITHMHSTHTYS